MYKENADRMVWKMRLCTLVLISEYFVNGDELKSINFQRDLEVLVHK